MNKKNRTKYLLLLVVFIYGTIALRFFFFNGNGSTDSDYGGARLEKFTPEKISEAVTFNITNDYRDPFLGTLPVRKTKYESSPNRKSSSSPKKKETINWPDLKYKGLVANPKNGKRIFALAIGDKEYIIRAGESQQGITLLKGSLEEVVVSFKKEIKTIAVLNK